MGNLKNSRNIINLGNKYKIDLSVFRYERLNDENSKIGERWHTDKVLSSLSSDTKLYKQRSYEIYKSISSNSKTFYERICSIGLLFGNIITEGIPNQNIFEYINSLRKMTCPITEDESFAYKLSKVQSEITHLFGIPYVNICIDNYIDNTFDIYFDSIKYQGDIENFDGLVQITGHDNFDEHYKIFADNTNVSMTIIVNFDRIYRYFIDNYGHKENATDKIFLGSPEQLRKDFLNAFISAYSRDQYRAHYTEQTCLILKILSEAEDTGLTQANTLAQNNWNEKIFDKYNKIIKDIYLNNFIDYEINKKLKDSKTKIKSSIDLGFDSIDDSFSFSNFDPSELMCSYEPTAPCLTQAICAYIPEYASYKSPNSCSLIYNDVRYPDSPTNIIKTSLYLCRLIPLLYFKVYFENKGKDHVNLKKVMEVIRKYLSFAQFELSKYELFLKGIIPYIENTLKFSDFLDSKFYNPLLTTNVITGIIRKLIHSLDYREELATPSEDDSIESRSGEIDIHG